MAYTIISRRTLATTGIAAVILAAVLGLTACGSSGSSTSTSTNASATSPSGTGGGTGTGTTGRPGGTGAFASRFKAVRECLQKNGITLPKRTPGQHQGGPGGFPGGGAGSGGNAGGPPLPSGMTRAQYESILKKCGGGGFSSGGFTGGGTRRLQSPAFKQALTNFAACMRESGVHIPAPNTSGNGPIFDTKGIDTTSSQFRTAEAKCRSNLTAAFRHPGGTSSGGGGSSSGGGGSGSSSQPSTTG